MAQSVLGSTFPSAKGRAFDRRRAPRSAATAPARAVALMLAFAGVAAGTAAEEPAGSITEEILVQAPRSAASSASAADRTSSTTVVAADRFAGEAKDVAAPVATSPGVAIQEYGGLGQLTTVSIRGAAADGVRVFLDGLPLNGTATGSIDLSTIPSAWVDRIEVVRGAEGARYGAGALGGVVVVHTRRAVPGDWSAQLSWSPCKNGVASHAITFMIRKKAIQKTA